MVKTVDVKFLLEAFLDKEIVKQLVQVWIIGLVIEVESVTIVQEYSELIGELTAEEIVEQLGQAWIIGLVIEVESMSVIQEYSNLVGEPIGQGRGDHCTAWASVNNRACHRSGECASECSSRIFLTHWGTHGRGDRRPACARMKNWACHGEPMAEKISRSCHLLHAWWGHTSAS